jgi:hypothetical protein
MKDDLIVPVYIDTNALLDILASIEGGFSIVEKVTSHTCSSSEKDRSTLAEAGTEFGIPNVLSLLKIKLGGSLSAKRVEESGEQRAIERYHTYGSLLHRLRSYLEAENLVRKLDGQDNVWGLIEPSSFVEIRGVIRPNPLADSFGRIDRIIGIIQLVSGMNIGSQSQQTSGKGGKPHSDTSQMTQIRKFMQGILTDIEKETIRTFVIEMRSPKGATAVALLYMSYLRDQTMAEIDHKEFRLLGKVVRKIEEGSEDTIDLLRGTGLGGIGKSSLDNLLVKFNQMEGVNLPEVKTEIHGPALEIIPIAVFV